LADKRA